MDYNNILYETDDRLAYITLNRPEKLNPLSHALRAEVYDAMKEAEKDPRSASLSCAPTAGLSRRATTSRRIPTIRVI